MKTLLLILLIGCGGKDDIPAIKRGKITENLSFSAGVFDSSPIGDNFIFPHFLYPQAFGAFPNDSCDDAPGIQAAIDSAELHTGWFVFMSCGNWVQSPGCYINMHPDRRSQKHLDMTIRLSKKMKYSLIMGSTLVFDTCYTWSLGFLEEVRPPCSPLKAF